MKKVINLSPFLYIFFAVFIGCKKSNSVADTNEKQASMAVENTGAILAPTPCGCWIAVTNQANNLLEAYDPSVTDWNLTNARKWTFEPTTGGGYDATAEIALWDDPTDVKLRNTTAFAGTSQAIATCGGRLATIAAYPSGNKIWTMGFGDFNPQVSLHSAELLPNGNIALASSKRNWVRVYSSSQAQPNHGKFGEFPLGDAHAVLWDPTYQRLWVTGWLPINSENYWDPLNQVITALKVEGTAADPKLVEDVDYRTVLPGKYGHDIAPYYYDHNKLWITVNVDNVDNNKGVYLFDKTTQTFTQAPGAANRNFVKGIGNQPSGEIVEIRPIDHVTGWTNNTVNFYSVTGSSLYNRTRSTAAFYKSRVFSPDYQ